MTNSRMTNILIHEVLCSATQQSQFPVQELLGAKEQRRDLPGGSAGDQEIQEALLLLRARRAAQELHIVAVNGMQIGLQRGQEIVGDIGPAAGAVLQDLRPEAEAGIIRWALEEIHVQAADESGG